MYSRKTLSIWSLLLKTEHEFQMTTENDYGITGGHSILVSCVRQTEILKHRLWTTCKVWTSCQASDKQVFDAGRILWDSLLGKSD